MPNNCTECEYSETCKSFYGAIGCAHAKEIVNAILKENNRCDIATERVRDGGLRNKKRIRRA